MTERKRREAEKQKGKSGVFNIQNSMLLLYRYMIPLANSQNKGCIYKKSREMRIYSLRRCKSKFNRATTFEQSLSPVSISGN
jgi:hypothetical protein